jgi:acyl-CoA thioesterase-1
MVSVPSGLLTCLLTWRDSSTCNVNLSQWLARATRALILAVAAALLAAGAAAADGAPAPALVVFGDSLSAGYGIRVEEGWVALLERRLAEQGYGYRVVNASVSGETTAGGLARLARVLDRQRPAIIVIELGGNDGLRGLPVAEMRRNLTELVRRARAGGARVLLVGTRMPNNYGPLYTEQYQGSFAAVARAEHVPLVGSLLEGIGLEERNFQADHLHPTAAVQPQLLETVWQALAPLLGPRPRSR